MCVNISFYLSTTNLSAYYVQALCQTLGIWWVRYLYDDNVFKILRIMSLFFFQNYFCGVLWEQKFQTHKKNVENCKKLLKKLGRCSSQKDVANYTLSCSLREELVAVSERKDICNAVGKLLFCLFFNQQSVSLKVIRIPKICTVVISYQYLFHIFN